MTDPAALFVLYGSIVARRPASRQAHGAICRTAGSTTNRLKWDLNNFGSSPNSGKRRLDLEEEIAVGAEAVGHPLDDFDLCRCPLDKVFFPADRQIAYPPFLAVNELAALAATATTSRQATAPTRSHTSASRPAALRGGGRVGDARPSGRLPAVRCQAGAADVVSQLSAPQCRRPPRRRMIPAFGRIQLAPDGQVNGVNDQCDSGGGPRGVPPGPVLKSSHGAVGGC